MMSCPCGSEHFALSPLLQTNQDGRANLMQDAPNAAPWVMHLVCAMCGLAFIADPNSKALHQRGSREASDLIEKYRIDFTKSFDPRQNDAPVVG